MKKQIKREDPVETIAAVIVVLLGLLILGGAFLTYQRASTRNTAAPFQPVISEQNGAEGVLHVQLAFERDGEIVRSDGYLDHIHVVESIQSDGILYSYAMDRKAPAEVETPTEDEMPEKMEDTGNTENTENFPENGEAESGE